MMQADKFITVYTACGHIEAEIVKGHLEVENIPSILKYESLGSVYGLTIDGLGQVEVQVPSKYLQQALDILRQSADLEDDIDFTGPGPQSEL
ncbi:MAG: DUF2007 domain-containing protein [Dehalococcoidia bacterium]|nr:DUF2007 domain-containing protein [Dehalococcoidia bacterium]